MKLWHLELLNPPQGLDIAHVFVIRAQSEDQARRIANESAMDEGAVWHDPAKASCSELTQDGDGGVIACEFVGF